MTLFSPKTTPAPGARYSTLGLRLSEPERAALLTAARREGLTLSDFARLALADRISVGSHEARPEALS